MIYEYECPGCGDVRQIERKMTDPEESYVCNTCGATLTRVWNSAPIHFNASGFYSSDNKPKY